MDYRVLSDLIENGLPFQKLLGNRVGNATVVLWSEDNPDQSVAKARGVYNLRRSER